MEPGHEELYIGIDLGNVWTQVSYFRPGMEEPQTVSTVAGEEKFRISTALCRKKESGQWYLIELARHSLEGEELICVDMLLEKSLKEDEGSNEVYPARELLPIFLRKVLRLVPGVQDISRISGLCFHLEQVDLRRVRLLQSMMAELGLARDRVFLQDERESFCHFAMNQKPELRLHDVALFCCEADAPQCLLLTRGKRSKPQMLDIEKTDLGELPDELKDRDLTFMKMAEQALEGRVTSAVYLCGDGFEGDWLQETVRFLCRGRRAFLGKNLFTKGACYGAQWSLTTQEPEYIYFSGSRLKENIFIKIKENGQERFHSLVDAGASRFELHGECQVLIDGDPFIDIWLKEPQRGDARIESLELTDFPKRPPRTSRLKIEVMPAEGDRILVRVTDMGFGPWFASSGKVWEYFIDE